MSKPILIIIILFIFYYYNKYIYIHNIPNKIIITNHIDTIYKSPTIIKNYIKYTHIYRWNLSFFLRYYGNKKLK